MYKKILVVLLAVVLTLSFSSCYYDNSKTIYNQGLQEYNEGSLDWGVCAYLLPEDMLTAYAYTNGDYFEYGNAGYYYLFSSVAPLATSSMYLEYDAETYEAAKQYMLENSTLAKEPVYTEQGYELYHCLELEQAYYPPPVVYPEWAIWRGFNDEKRTLYFFGLYSSGEEADKAVGIYEEEGFKGYLKEYYSGYYDFGV